MNEGIFQESLCQAVPKLKPVINMLILGMKNQSMIFVFAETNISYRRGRGCLLPRGRRHVYITISLCSIVKGTNVTTSPSWFTSVGFFSLYIKVIWVPHCRYLIWLRYTAMDTHRLASGRPRYISKNWQRIMCDCM